MKLAELNSHSAKLLAGMVMPAFRGLLEHAGAGRVVVVAAFDGSRAYGLALARVTDKVGEVLSVLVVPAQRGRGVGTLVLGGIEEALRRMGAAVARISWSTEMTGLEPLSRVLEKRGWSVPRGEMELLRILPRVMRDAWTRERPRRGEGEIFSWSDLTPGEEAQLRAWRGQYPRELWPLDHELEADAVVSVGWRREGEVRGWMVGHRVGPATVRYTTAYIHEARRNLRARGFFAVLTEAMRRHYAADGEAARATLAIRWENAGMLQIARRRLHAAAETVAELRVSEKLL